MMDLGLIPRAPKLAMEFIQVQKDNYGKELELLFQELIVFCNDNPTFNNKEIVKLCPQIKAIEKSVFDRFGLKISIIASDYTIMGVLPMIMNKYHVFLHESLHGFDGIAHQEAALKMWDGQTGWVDTSKAKVGGMFSSYTHQFFMNPIYMVRQCGTDAGEMTAILLHEVGHLFDNYEFSSRLESTNQVLAELTNAIKLGEDAKKTEYLYAKYLDLTNSQEDRDLLTSGKTRVVIGAELFRKHFNYMKSQLPNRKYDETSSEMSADLFASRFGYGRQLVNGLDKTVIEGDKELISSINFTVNTIELMSLTAYIFIGLVGGPFVALGIAGWMIFILNLSGTNNQDMTYDVLKDRYLRVRQHYVQMLKNSGIDREEAQKIINDIYVIDDLVKNIKPFRSIFKSMADFIFPSHRDAKNDIAVQRLLESLAHNDLFLKAAELKAA